MLIRKRYLTTLCACLLSSASYAMPKEAVDDVVKCVPSDYHYIMYKIVKAESKGNPLAVNVNGNTKLQRQPASQDEAIYWSRYLFKQGYSIDLGYAQINSVHFKKNGLFGKSGFKIDHAFDVCTNLQMGAYIFAQAYIKYGDVAKALSVYNTGSPIKGIKNGYVNKVLGNA